MGLLSMAHSYRVNSAIEQCFPLSSSAVERPSNEKAMCASSPSSPLQVSYSSQVTQAKVLRHAVLHRTGQVCFSKEMLPECDIDFKHSASRHNQGGRGTGQGRHFLEQHLQEEEKEHCI